MTIYAVSPPSFASSAGARLSLAVSCSRVGGASRAAARCLADRAHDRRPRPARGGHAAQRLAAVAQAGPRAGAQPDAGAQDVAAGRGAGRRTASTPTSMSRGAHGRGATADAVLGFCEEAVLAAESERPLGADLQRRRRALPDERRLPAARHRAHQHAADRRPGDGRARDGAGPGPLARPARLRGRAARGALGARRELRQLDAVQRLVGRRPAGVQPRRARPC